MQRRLLVFLLLCLAGPALQGRQKLYILSSAGHDVTVVDVASNRIVGTVEVGDRPHGVAAPRSADVLYVSTEYDNSLAVIDPRTDTLRKKYTVFGARPNEIDVTSDGRLVYLPILGHGVYEVFDTARERIVARIATFGLPHNVVISPDDRYAYLAPMGHPGVSPERLAAEGYPTIDNDCIYVVEVATQRVVATIALGSAPRPVAIRPDGKRLYANVDGLQGFVVMDARRAKVLARVAYDLSDDERQRPSRSHGIVVTPDGREVWTSDVNLGLVFAYDATVDPPRALARMDNEDPVYWLTVTPDGKTVYASSATADSVTAYDAVTHRRTGRIRLPEGTAPKRILVLDVPEAHE